MNSKENIWNNENLVKVLNENGVVVMPTDTIYGIVGKAESESVVDRIYTLRNRDIKKPCIILIGDISELEKFSINLSEKQKNALESFKTPTSFVLDCPDEKFLYLHRGTQTLAFRLPGLIALRSLLLKVGPLIAPSANPEKFPSSKDIEDAKKYFGDAIDLYIDGGVLTNKASRVIKLHKDGSVSILRE